MAVILQLQTWSACVYSKPVQEKSTNTAPGDLTPNLLSYYSTGEHISDLRLSTQEAADG